MEVAGYISLSRQTGLLREMQIVANNIANTNTVGFRQQGIVFSEYLKEASGDQTVAMSAARVPNSSFLQGALARTGNAFDFAIEGAGYFLIGTPDGDRLTRAGNFSTNNESQLVTAQGYPVLDLGGAPVFVPGDDFSVGEDGTISAGGRQLGKIGIFRPLPETSMTRESDILFSASDGTEAVETPKLLQGFLESSNVNPILQITRMIDVQRAYEMNQSFIEREDDRIRAALKTLIK